MKLSDKARSNLLAFSMFCIAVGIILNAVDRRNQQKRHREVVAGLVEKLAECHADSSVFRESGEWMGNASPDRDLLESSFDPESGEFSPFQVRFD